MFQADAVRFLPGNGVPADVIHQHLVDVFGPMAMAMAYSTVTRRVKEMNWTTPEATQEKLKGRPTNDFVDCSIQNMLNREPGSSVREIAQELSSPVSTVFYALTVRMGYSSRKCHLVPQMLTPKQKEDRFRQSCELLDVLQAAKKLRWTFILTGDESWFFYCNLKGKLWLPPDVDTPQVARQVFNTPKVMMTLFWNPWGVHVRNALLSESFNGDYFVRHSLQPIHSLQIVAVAHKEKKRCILHIDNSPIRKAKLLKAKSSQMPIHLAPHPPYSPDHAPADFFLFRPPKEKILGLEFESPEV
jgi:histone-lysine N-methyltransferase SETMAR